MAMCKNGFFAGVFFHIWPFYWVFCEKKFPRRKSVEKASKWPYPFVTVTFKTLYTLIVPFI